MTDKKIEIKLLYEDLNRIENFQDFECRNWMQNDAFHNIKELFMKGFNRSPFK